MFWRMATGSNQQRDSPWATSASEIEHFHVIMHPASMKLLRRFLFLAIVCAFMSACSYEVKWHQARGTHGLHEGPAGAYVGRWDSSRHTMPGGKPAGGRLMAILLPEPTAPGLWNAEFQANWLGIIETPYRAAFRFSPDEKRFAIESNLSGLGGGFYRCTGVRKGDTLSAKYTSAYDSGTFVLERQKLKPRK
jgi:hypothetical protein